MPSYLIPSQLHEYELEIKRSRFIARIERVDSRAQAMDVLEQNRKLYPDARHHCWAYLIGPSNKPSTVAMSDDGEPSGTAGKPILNVIQHREVGNIIVVVSKYFGGTKLGAGGLVRAYSQATTGAYEGLKTEVLVEKVSCLIHCPFSQEQQIRHWLSQYDADGIHEVYSDRVEIRANLPASDILNLEGNIQRLTESSIEILNKH